VRRAAGGIAAVRDPFDRLIVAAARSLRRPWLSADDAIAASGLVEVIWH
jgi:PIN domain nuclease of toxin-antitoxin system